jgi:amidophosphoribosyltransferase
VLPVLEGAYSLLLLTANRLIAVKDPAAFRPLCIGRFDGSYVFSSETCAFDLIGAEYMSEVGPGEIVICDQNGMQIRRAFPTPRTSHCIFEHVYFARPDSQVFAYSVYQARHTFGRQLARESYVEADVVVPVPDSGVTAAIGYAAESGIPFDFGLTRNHYIGRTFIEPHQAIRQFGVRVKLNPVRHILQGRRVVLIDDSIVRGTTSRKIVNMIRAAGAMEVHLRISSPQIVSPCFYGIDTPTRQELIAAHKSIDEIAQFIGADSVGYLSLNGMLSAVSDPEGLRHCTACFTGKYTIVTEEMTRALNIQENPTK